MLQSWTMEWKAFWIGSIFTAIFLEAIQGQLEADVIRYRIQEGSPVGTFVGDVAGDSGLLDILPEDAMQDIQYNFLDATGAFMNSHPYLAISPETGILTTAQVIDREKFCSTRSTCYLDVEVAISPTAYFQVINIRLEIQDVNDNTPDFGQLTAFIDIPESALVGSGYTLPLASDPDGLEYGITAYSIESRSGVPFELQVIPNIQDPLSLELVVREPLDRETVAGYEFYVVARDGGTPAKTARLKVNVTVTDINDNHPVFRSEQYTVRVMENSVVPKQLISVSATDADYGANGRITYEFSSTTRDNFGHLFEVDQDSGMITLVEPLDREEVSEYTLTVTARDRGVGSRLASTNVIVTVLDDNDNNPKVNVNSPTEDGKPVVSEAASIGTFIALVSVTDSDLGQNGVVTCTVNSSKFDIRPLQKRKYKIVTASIFDRESTEVYNITLTCHDHGTPMQVTNTLVSIQIGDENDHAPVFDQAFYEAEVEENSPPGMTVAQVKATDNDAGANAQITYTLYGQLSHYFEVDPMSGIITTHTELDHETYSELSITVGAKDNGDPQLSSNTEVRIKVKDVNDEAPIFTQDVYTFVAVENKPRGFELGRVEAFDRDAAPFNHITYAITDTINRTSGLNVFDLDKDSGIISTKVTLDRETTPVYFLIIAASNEGFEGLTGTATVTIFVADDNDNAPVLDFPNKDNNTVTISSHANEHDIVTQIRSHDLDTGHNAAVSYELRMYDEAFWDAFIIDSLSGLVYVNKDLSYITEFTTIKVKVTATDQGTITLAAQGDLFVHVDPNLKVIVDIPTDYNDSGAHDDRKQGEEDNMFVIIVVVAISGVLIIILLTAIIFVLLRSRRSRHESRNGVKALPSSASNVGKTVEANKYVTEEVEWIKGDPETGSQLSDSKVLYKKPLKQNNTKAGRASPAVEEWEKNVLQNNFRESPRPSTFRSHVPSTRGHELGISYVPPDPSYGTGKRKRSNDKRMAELRKLQLATSGGDELCPDLDTSSASSGDMSNADSGRGASEEGEGAPPPLPRQDYKPPLIYKKNQGSSYPRLTSFQSPAQSQPTSPKSAQSPCLSESCEDPLATSSLNRQTVRNVKARDKSKKGGEDTGESYSILNNVLSKINEKPTDYTFNNSDSLFRYKGQGHNQGRGRRSSGTPSEMTDMTGSTTSGSYMLQPDVDDSSRNLKEVDV